jgi:hypothetical protein
MKPKFSLVTSHVESSVPEDDLFAGITPDVTGEPSPTA